MNYDACFDATNLLGEWGFIIRDNDGDAVNMGRGRIDHMLEAYQAEVIVSIHGVKMAINLGIRNVEIETGALRVVNAVNAPKNDNSVAEGLLMDLWELLYENFISVKFNFVPRTCNEVAHELLMGVMCGVGTNSIVDDEPICC